MPRKSTPVPDAEQHLAALLHYLETAPKLIWEWARQQHPKLKYEPLKTSLGFVRKHGQSYTPTATRNGRKLRRRKARECFFNCMDEVLKDKGLVYVEGFAISHIAPMPVEHAWCTDETGAAYDFTWKEPGIVYFGVPFQTEYVRQQWMELGLQGELQCLIRMDESGFHPRGLVRDWKWRPGRSK